MNAKQLIAALITVAAAGSAVAQATLVAQTPASGITRAQVMAEYQQARAAGQLNQLDADYPRTAAVTSTLTRADVMAEYKRAKANGEIAQNDFDYPILPVVKSTLTRQQVIAEFKRSQTKSAATNPFATINYANSSSSSQINTR